MTVQGVTITETETHASVYVVEGIPSGNSAANQAKKAHANRYGLDFGEVVARKVQTEDGTHTVLVMGGDKHRLAAAEPRRQPNER